MYGLLHRDGISKKNELSTPVAHSNLEGALHPEKSDDDAFGYIILQ
jgi:hypothetical protein